MAAIEVFVRFISIIDLFFSFFFFSPKVVFSFLPEEVDEDVTEGFNVVPSRLLHAQMRRNGGVARGARQRLALPGEE